jgi:hemerythrin
MKHQTLTWDPSFELGVKEIDFQHHYFVELINRLRNDLSSEADPSLRSYLIGELNAYAKFHFLSEENLMRKADYPDLKIHQQHHFDLINSLGVRGGQLQVGYSEESVERIIDFLVDWFKHHTMTEDRKFSEFLNARN